MALPDGVGWTALMTAYARAQETRRREPLFVDDWATAVIAEAADGDPGSATLPRLGPAVDDGSSGLWSSLETYFVARTPFYDEHVRAGVAEGVNQVVLLAAGFDGRALRLGLPAGTTVYEVDRDPVLSFKDRALGAPEPAPGVLRRVVRCDLREDWAGALRSAGFDPQRPAVWLAEGLFMYLDGGQSDRLLDDIAALSAPGSRLATEYFERNPVGERSLLGWEDEEDRRVGELLGREFRSGPPAPPRAWFGAHGWQVLEVTDVAGQAARCGRRVPAMFDPAQPDGLRVHLVAGRR